MVCRGNFDFLFLVIFGFVDTKQVIWRFDNDISNADNWVGGKLAEDCKGVHFAAVNSAPVFVESLTAAELTFPHDGEIILSNDVVVELKDNKKCINLKPFNHHDWYDPDSWRLADNNAAVPDKEKIPCQHDDVILPNQFYLPVESNTNTRLIVNSVTVKDKKQHSNPIMYPEDTITFEKSSKCLDPYGCLCHDELIFCLAQESAPKLKCLHPVTPEEYCHEICGAYLTYNPGKGPNLEQLKKHLKEYEVDTHASRVKNYLGKEVVQVVFSEEEYSGKSLEEAEEFLRYLLSSEAESVQIYKSGQFHVDGGSTLGIIFGSLVGVVVFFGVVFYVYGDGSINVIINRFNTNRGRDSIFSVPFFARFDNTDENLIIDGQSESGSILDIPKSFDNPLYGQSTSTTESQHENPLYEVTKDTHDEE